MAQKTSQVYVDLDGETLECEPGGAIDVGGVMREAVVSDTGRVHYTERTKQSTVTVTLIHLATTDLAAINAFAGTLTYRTDTGVRYIISDAFVTEMGQLSNGAVEVSFAGSPAVQA